jgi:hypothetical protein
MTYITFTNAANKTIASANRPVCTVALFSDSDSSICLGSDPSFAKALVYLANAAIFQQGIHDPIYSTLDVLEAIHIFST